jgi:hypothetical protein
MANAAIAFENLADDATITASDFAGESDPSLLVTSPHVGVKWRDNSSLTWLVADLGAVMLIDTVMLAGLSGVSPTLRVRLSITDPTGAAGEVSDSGSISGLPYFDDQYGLFVYLLTTPLSARYVRIDISEGGVDYIEAGRLFIGEREAFSINFQAPWQRIAVRSSSETIGVGGQTFVDLRVGHWETRATFSFLTVAEREGFLEAVGTAIVNEGHLDMLWMMDPDTSNLSRDSIWGYPVADLEMSADQYLVPPVYNVTFNIRQRL